MKFPVRIIRHANRIGIIIQRRIRGLNPGVRLRSRAERKMDHAVMRLRVGGAFFLVLLMRTYPAFLQRIIDARAGFGLRFGRRVLCRRRARCLLRLLLRTIVRKFRKIPLTNLIVILLIENGERVACLLVQILLDGIGVFRRVRDGRRIAWDEKRKCEDAVSPQAH